MNEKNIDILAIDDDKVVQKVIIKSLQSSALSVRVASDGDAGIDEATRQVPDIILLDVEMPGISGYEVCDRLRNIEATKEVPIVFLSSHSSLRERMQGYEAGADDYLVKPFEKENLLARVNVLVKYHNERIELREQYALAHQSAMTAMTGSSELGLAIRFLEKSLSYQSINDLAQGLFESTDQFFIDCCLMINDNGNILWYSSESTAISPLEKELIEMCDKDARFLDFGTRTIVNYPRASLLVKNMPLDDMDRYGRTKDLLPILLSAVNSKINTLGTQEALTQQSSNLLESVKLIRSSLFNLGTGLVKNRRDSIVILNKLVQDLNYDFLRMGLEEDQEAYLLNRIDTAIEAAMVEMDSGAETRCALTTVLANLNSVITTQEELFDAFTASLAAEAAEQSGDLDDSVELF
ncbi:MAG: response regulator [Gammaproteobacteria bacterium]|nr:response regulator [Gammaproteobacteria bacterium]